MTWRHAWGRRGLIHRRFLQGFPLADSAAARLLAREYAWLSDYGEDRKVVHAEASLAKLFASEATFRCADRVVQVFGGRGYMRVLPRMR